MRKAYFFSFFCAILFFGLVYYGAYYYTTYYLTDSGVEQNEISAEKSKTEEIKKEELKPETVAADTIEAQKIGPDTTFIMETYDMDQYRLEEQEEPIPIEYIGKTREEMIDYLTNYMANLGEEESLRGLVSMDLISFSDEKIIVRKSYDAKEAEDHFYLTVKDYYVVVLKEDMRTVYTYTDIPLTSLPEDVKQEILDIKYVDSLYELYSFLENYSS